jgi:hypothetical protein
MKLCKQCNTNKPLSDFGHNAANINRGARDGKNIVCKLCIRQKVAAHRLRLRDYRAVHGTVKPRKPRRIIRSLRSLKLTPEIRVCAAIQRGADTQQEIVRLTKLPKDEVGEAIAHLLLWSGEIRTEVIENKRRYFINDGLIKIRREPIRPREPRSHGVSTIYFETSAAELYYSDGRVAKG